MHDDEVGGLVLARPGAAPALEVEGDRRGFRAAHLAAERDHPMESKTAVLR